MKTICVLLVLASITACNQKQTLNGLLPGGASSSSSPGTPVSSPTPNPTVTPTPAPTSNPTPVPTQPTATPTPTSSPTSTPKPTATPSPTPSTGGGVNWLDPLAYTKPAFVQIAEPAENSVQNKYYIDLSSGSGSACTQSSPCANLESLLGKPGITGGPAFIYVKGTGQFWLYNDNFYGSPGKEIVIKPWPGFTAVSTTGGSGGKGGTFNGSSIHDIIIDGGPSLGIKFVNDGSMNNYAMHFEANNITVYRVEGYCTQGNVSGVFSGGDFTPVNNFRIINVEAHDCANTTAGQQASMVYLGPGSTGGYANASILNNVIYNMGGEGMEINPRVVSTGLIIAGNAIHNVGKQTCSGAWNCRPAITLNSQNGQDNPNTQIYNNLMWDTGSSCIWARFPNGATQYIYNNTCYDYAKVGSDPWPQGIATYEKTGTATVKNNIIYAPNGTAPFDGSPFTQSNNICNGNGCTIPYSSSVFLSTDPNNPNFLKIGSSSTAVNAGTTTGVPNDYLGNARPHLGSYDIGAFEY